MNEERSESAECLGTNTRKYSPAHGVRATEAKGQASPLAVRGCDSGRDRGIRHVSVSVSVRYDVGSV